MVMFFYVTCSTRGFHVFHVVLQAISDGHSDSDTGNTNGGHDDHDGKKMVNSFIVSNNYRTEPLRTDLLYQESYVS